MEYIQRAIASHANNTKVQTEACTLIVTLTIPLFVGWGKGKATPNPMSERDTNVPEYEEEGEAEEKLLSSVNTGKMASRFASSNIAKALVDVIQNKKNKDAELHAAALKGLQHLSYDSTQ